MKSLNVPQTKMVLDSVKKNVARYEHATCKILILEGYMLSNEIKLGKVESLKESIPS